MSKSSRGRKTFSKSCRHEAGTGIEASSISLQAQLSSALPPPIAALLVIFSISLLYLIHLYSTFYNLSHSRLPWRTTSMVNYCLQLRLYFITKPKNVSTFSLIYCFQVTAGGFLKMAGLILVPDSVSIWPIRKFCYVAFSPRLGLLEYIQTKKLVPVNVHRQDFKIGQMTHDNKADLQQVWSCSVWCSAHHTSTCLTHKHSDVRRENMSSE